MKQVDTQVEVELAAVIDGDLESFLDLLAEEAGYPLLMDIYYNVVGHVGDQLLIRVRGEVEA